MRILLAAAAVFALLAAPALAADYTVVIKNMKFGPAPSGLHVGDVVTWQNDDILRHTATARDKSFDIDLPPHSSKELTLKKAGTFAFYCKFHPGMTGTLVVAP